MASEAYLRSQYEALLKENKLLKQNADKLDRENHDLKRSVYELSLKLDTIQNVLLGITGHSGCNGGVLPNKNVANHANMQRLISDAMEPFEISDLLASSTSDTERLKSFSLLDESVDTRKGRETFEDFGDNKIFYAKSDLRAHTGAVYTAKFSPSGRILASGSLDCKIILWDLTTKVSQQQLASLTQHQQLIIDVSWSNDSVSLLSASYDHTVRLWDVEKGNQTNLYQLQGLVQCVMFNAADNHQFLCGTSKNAVHQGDARTNDVVATWQNDAMVNTVYIMPCSQYFITGDSKGMIRTWDLRMSSCIEELTRANDSENHAISHIHVSPDSHSGTDEDGRFLAANSYDNMLRVYDRRFKLISSSHGDQMQLSYVIAGHKNKNWPIKSSFYRGEGYKYKLLLPAHTQESLSETEHGAFQDSDHVHATQETLLLATGSADNKIYLHDVSIKHPDGKPSPYLLQKIDAHSDRVYCVDFHPSEPIMASASADFSVKIWLPRTPARRARTCH